MCYKKLKWERNELFSLVQGNRGGYEIQKRKFSVSKEIFQREEKNELVAQLQYSRTVSEKKSDKTLSLGTMEK